MAISNIPKKLYAILNKKNAGKSCLCHLRELWQLEGPREDPVVELLRVPLPDDVPVRVHHEQVGDPGVGLQGSRQHHGTDLHVLAAVVDGLEEGNIQIYSNGFVRKYAIENTKQHSYVKILGT